jgi:predicted phage-related endonuclease
MRQVHELIQGSKEWHDFRAKHFTASDAAVMLGMSKYKTRDQLLKEKATGFTPEIDAATKKRFEDGHLYEFMCRKVIERLIGEDLYPATASLVVDGLPLSVSCDGLTMDEKTAWEHKTLNAALEVALSKGEIPDEYHPQCEQLCLVLGLDVVNFTASKGTKETAISAIYQSNPQLRQQIIEGWKQFKIDLDSYQVRESVVEPIGRAPSDIPALVVNVSGNVLASNLGLFKAQSLAVLNNINTELNSDQDFADAEKTVKWCANVESKLEATRSNVLQQTQDIYTVLQAIDEIKEEARIKRLFLEKLVKQRKEAIRGEIASEAKAEWSQHMLDLASTLHPVKMPLIMCDIPSAMKGKRTIDTLRSAANDEVARAKIEANVIANKFQANLKIIRENTGHYQFLFNDLQQLVENNNPESLLAVMRQRIADHEAKESARIEAEAQRIAAQKIEQERREREAKERQEREAAQRAEQQEAARAAAEAVKPLEQAEPMPKSILHVMTNSEGTLQAHTLDLDKGGVTIADVPESVQQSVAQDHFRGVRKMVDRPTDEEIIEAVANAFSADKYTALCWIEAMDLFGEKQYLNQVRV